MLTGALCARARRLCTRTYTLYNDASQVSLSLKFCHKKRRESFVCILYLFIKTKNRINSTRYFLHNQRLYKNFLNIPSLQNTFYPAPAWNCESNIPSYAVHPLHSTLLVLFQNRLKYVFFICPPSTL